MEGAAAWERQQAKMVAWDSTRMEFTNMKRQIETGLVQKKEDRIKKREISRRYRRKKRTRPHPDSKEVISFTFDITSRIHSFLFVNMGCVNTSLLAQLTTSSLPS